MKNASWKAYARQSVDDADGDGIVDRDDALPLTAAMASLVLPEFSADDVQGLKPLADTRVLIKQLNFSGNDAPTFADFDVDHGEVFSDARWYGWGRDIQANHRLRGSGALLSDTFIFTRTHDVWECALPNGKYWVDVSIGDAGHVQAGQNLSLEGEALFRAADTVAGQFLFSSTEVEVLDGKLTLEIGLEGGTTNTCLNWVRISQEQMK